MEFPDKKFGMVVCGGTFDHFHKGHETFLRYVFSIGKKIIVGLTSDEYVEKLKINSAMQNQKSKIESFEKRKDGVLKFLGEKNVSNKAEIIKIDDLFGPTLSDGFQIDAIVVSGNTKNGAELINERRKKLGLSPLKIIIAPFVRGEDGKIISSLAIRKGIIDREGNLYIKPGWLSNKLQLTEKLRKLLKKPFGQLIKNENDLVQKPRSFCVSTVGDVTSKLFNDLDLNQNISVVDFTVGRKKKFSSLTQLGFLGKEEVIEVDNPASFLTPSLFSAAIKAFLLFYQKKRVIIKVNGEEDLAVLPLLLAAPLGSLIWYGQPKEGIVQVVATEEAKEKAYEIVEQFTLNTRGY